MPQRNPAVTGAVATALLDLADPANEAHDLFEGTSGYVEDGMGVPSTAQQIFEVFDRDLDALPEGVTSFTSHDFLPHIPGCARSAASRSTA